LKTGSKIGLAHYWGSWQWWRITKSLKTKGTGAWSSGCPTVFFGNGKGKARGGNSGIGRGGRINQKGIGDFFLPCGGPTDGGIQSLIKTEKGET